MTNRSYKDLEAWQKAIETVSLVYDLTKPFPKEEQTSLASSIRQLAVAIPTYIAEGRAQRRVHDYIHFLNLAHGAAAGLETQIIVSKNLGYMPLEQAEQVLQETARVCRLVTSLLWSIEKKLPNGTDAEDHHSQPIPHSSHT